MVSCILLRAHFALRQQVFSAFTEEFLSAPFTDRLFHFVIPALADAQTGFPYEPFLSALLADHQGTRASAAVPWVLYFVLTVGENHLGRTWGALALVGKVCMDQDDAGHGGGRAVSQEVWVGGQQELPSRLSGQDQVLAPPSDWVPHMSPVGRLGLA